MSRTAVDLSFAGAEVTWLACVRVAVRVVGGSKAHSMSRSGGRRSGQGRYTFLVARRVWVTEISVLTVYLAAPLVVPSQST